MPLLFKVNEALLDQSVRLNGHVSLLGMVDHQAKRTLTNPLQSNRGSVARNPPC